MTDNCSVNDDQFDEMDGYEVTNLDHNDYIEHNHVTESPSSKGKKKRSHWTKEKIETAKRLCERGYKPKDIACATGMSLRASQQFYSDIFPDEDGGQWRDFVIGKRGPKKKDKSELHNKIKEILREDRTLTFQEISDRLPQDMKRSKTVIGKELKEIKGMNKVMANRKRLQKK